MNPRAEDAEVRGAEPDTDEKLGEQEQVTIFFVAKRPIVTDAGFPIIPDRDLGILCTSVQAQNDEASAFIQQIFLDTLNGLSISIEQLFLAPSAQTEQDVKVGSVLKSNIVGDRLMRLDTVHAGHLLACAFLEQGI